MSVPVLSTATSRLWLAERDPNNSEVYPMDVGNFWFNTIALTFWICVDNTVDMLRWRSVAL